MRKIAVISGILENPQETQKQFNEIVSAHREIVKGRMGLPFDTEGIAVIVITVVATVDQINSFTGQLGKLPSTIVKTAISKKEVE